MTVKKLDDLGNTSQCLKTKNVKTANFICEAYVI
jgi:hypothetical protein